MTIDTSNEKAWIKDLTALSNGAASWSGQSGTPVTITYSFDSSKAHFDGQSGNPATVKNFAPDQLNNIRQILGYISDVSGITFIEDNTNPQLVLMYENDPGFTTNGNRTARDPGNTDLFVQSDIYINDIFPNFAPGSSGAGVILHEILHAMGLSHPQGVDTLPSYNVGLSATSVNGYTLPDIAQPIPTAQTPSVYDIATLQFLYGPNTSHNSGNTPYTFSPNALPTVSTIWDAGGTDIFAVSANITEGSRVDLRAGRAEDAFRENFDKGLADVLQAKYISLKYQNSNEVLSSYINKQSLISSALPFGGENGEGIIEQAAGGSGHDLIFGNQLNNVLYGGIGDDAIFTGKGENILLGGADNDIFVIEAEASANVIHGGFVRNHVDAYKPDWDAAGHFTGLNNLAVETDGMDTLSYAAFDGAVQITYTDATTRSGTVGKIAFSGGNTGEDTFYSIEKFIGNADAINTLEVHGNVTVREHKGAIDFTPIPGTILQENFKIFQGDAQQQHFEFLSLDGHNIDGGGGGDTVTLNGDFSLNSGNSLHVGSSSVISAATAQNINTFEVAEGTSGYFVINQLGNDFSQADMPQSLPVENYTTLSYKNYSQSLTFGFGSNGLSGADFRRTITDGSGAQDTYKAFNNAVSIVGTDHGDTFYLHGYGSSTTGTNANFDLPIFTGTGNDVIFSDLSNNGLTRTQPIIYSGGDDVIHMDINDLNDFATIVLPLGITANDVSFQLSLVSSTDIGGGVIHHSFDGVLTVAGMGTITTKGLGIYTQFVDGTGTTGGIRTDTYLFQDENGWNRMAFNTDLSIPNNLTFEELQALTQARFGAGHVPPSFLEPGFYQGTFDDDVFDLSVFNGHPNFTGYDGNDTIIGSDADNIIEGGAGDDIIAGRGGNDLLKGGAGNDTYLFAAGDGFDTIVDYDGFNKLKLEGAIDLASIQYIGVGDDLHLKIASGVIIQGYYSNVNTISVIETDDLTQFDFSGEAANAIRLPEGTIPGTNGDDVLSGDSGNNILAGLAGNDVYEFAAGSGTDTILDTEGINTIRFLDPIDPTTLAYNPSGNDLIIQGTDQIIVANYFSEPNTITNIEIATTGQIFNLADLVEQYFNAPGEDFIVNSGETITGTVQSETFTFTGAASTAFGMGGNDIFYSNFGGHNIDGGDGTDTLNYAAYFEANFLTADIVIVADDGFGGSFAESFIDGEFRTDTFTNIEKYVTGAGNDSISGTTNDEIFNTGDGDDVVFGGGFDDPGSINGGNNLFIDGAGSDQYIGTAGGIDTVSYAELDTDGEGVNVFLGSGGTGERQIVVYDPDDPDADPEIIIETDTLDYIDNVIGTQFNDTLGGGFDGDHVFDGGGGANLYNIAMGGGFHHTIIDGNSASRLFLISSSLFDDRVEDLRVAQDGNDMLVSNIVSGASIRLIDFMITPTIGQLRLREDGQFITITAQDLLTALDTGGIIGGEAPNEAPLAQDDSFTGTEDVTVTGNVLADNGNGADSDADGDPLTITPATLTTAQGGSVELLANGDFTYTPAADFNGQDSFTYTVTDGNGGSDTATVTLDITPVNDAPVAADDVFVMDEDTVLSGNLLVDNGNGADSDVDGDTLSVVAETLVTAKGGTVEILANGDFTYTPAENFNGTDSFSYTLDDGNGGTAVGNVSLTVNAVNDAPLAADDTAVTDEDTAVVVNVLANDSDVENDTLSVSAVTDGANGTVTHDGTSVTYTPDADFFGADSFTYTVSDGNGGFDTATVNVTVNPVNDNPVAANDSFTGDEDSVIAGNVLADNGNGVDSDIDGDTLSVVAETLVTAQGGTVDILANGDFTYTPAENFNGADSFSYTLEDGNGGTDIGQVSLTVNPVNDAPVANDDVATTDEDTAVVIDVLANDTDVDNDVLSVFAANDGANGTVSFDGTSVTYTPNTGFSGADSFTYTVSDGNGGFDTATVNVTVNAATTNTPPVANDDDFTVEHGNALTGNLLADNGHGADSDADNDNLTVTAAAIMTLAGATVTILANGDFTYEGAAGFVGTDSFEYTLEDGNGGFDTAFANITVTAPQGAVVGTEGDDNVVSGSGNDAVFLPGGNNTVSSGSGNDAIYAGSGDDQIASGSGDDIVNITGGNNGVQGGSGNDSVTTGDGDDVIDGGSGNDVIISSGGDNVITGGSGDDFLQTGWGNDLLIGGSGNDWLDGGAGINTLIGGSGADTFVLGTLNAQNTVTDFDTWDGDKLHLADLLTGFDPLAHALSDFVQTAQNGNNTHISVDSDGTGTAFAMTEIAVLENTALDLDDLTAGGHLLIA